MSPALSNAEKVMAVYLYLLAALRAASEALQYSITSPGRADPVEEQSAADEAMAKLAAEIRLGSPRGQAGVGETQRLSGSFNVDSIHPCA